MFDLIGELMDDLERSAPDEYYRSDTIMRANDLLATFRRKQVTDADIVSALDQAKEQVLGKPKSDINIVHPNYAKNTAS